MSKDWLESFRAAVGVVAGFIVLLLTIHNSSLPDFLKGFATGASVLTFLWLFVYFAYPYRHE